MLTQSRLATRTAELEAMTLTERIAAIADDVASNEAHFS
jgi:hypothetical protein